MNNIKQKIRDLNEEIAEIDVEIAAWSRLPRGPIGDSYIARLNARRADLLLAKVIWKREARGDG